MRNSEKRKVKRSFPRPKASAILGLEQEGPFSMQNTISTNNKRVELLMENGKDVNNMISSIENSSVEQNQQMNPKLSNKNNTEFLVKVAEEEARGTAALQSAQPELAHPP